MSYFWLSFADKRKPKGRRFLGVCVIKADSFPHAVTEAWRLNCNPGGEVLGHEIEKEYEKNISVDGFPLARLLTNEEARELDERIAGTRH